MNRNESSERSPSFGEGVLWGRAETLRELIPDLCAVLGVELTTERRAAIASLDLEGLDALWVHLRQHRGWPIARLS